MVVKIVQGDALSILKTLKSDCINTCITSPPYWGLRDYGCPGQLGLEPSPDLYVQNMVDIFRQVRRCLRPDGTLWLNLGDSYVGGGNGGGGSFAKDGIRCAEPGTNKNERPFWKKGRTQTPDGLKPKDLVGIPWRVAFALQADGWYLRQDIIWAKPNPMPESVRDRCTKSHEYLFLLSKEPKYFFDATTLAEPASNAGKRVSLGAKSFAKGQASGANVAPSGNGLKDFYDVPATRNRRSVWTITTKPFKEAHFATFPPDLVGPCALAGCPTGGYILDPFAGSGTVGLVANKLNRHAILFELNPDYVEMAKRRCNLTPAAGVTPRP